MAPGDMVLYESSTVVHGRPAPLQGRYFANVFIHFMPVDENGNDLHVGSSEEMAAGRVRVPAPPRTVKVRCVFVPRSRCHARL
jgi:hypothetical protein